MLPDIRVEQYQEAADKMYFDGIKWLTKYWVKIKFSDRDIAYAMKDKIDKFLRGEAQQRTWVGLTDEDHIDWEDGGNLKDLVKAIEAKLKDKNL